LLRFESTVFFGVMYPHCNSTITSDYKVQSCILLRSCLKHGSGQSHVCHTHKSSQHNIRRWKTSTWLTSYQKGVTLCFLETTILLTVYWYALLGVRSLITLLH